MSLVANRDCLRHEGVVRCSLSCVYWLIKLYTA